MTGLRGVITPEYRGVMTEKPNAGQELDEIMRDMDAATAAWADAGYGYGTPEDEAREAVFARLREWNQKNAR